MSDKAFNLLRLRVDALTIVLTELLDAGRLYESAIMSARGGGDCYHEIEAARKKRHAAIERLEESTKL